MARHRSWRWRAGIAPAVPLIILCIAWGVFRWNAAIVVVAPTVATSPLLGGDRLLMTRHAYRYRPPRRGDLVLVRRAGTPWPARVLALSGETLIVDADTIRIDGATLPRWRVADAARHARRYRVVMPGGRMIDLPTIAPIRRTTSARSVLVLRGGETVPETVPMADIAGRGMLVLFSADPRLTWRRPDRWWPALRWSRAGLRL